MAYIGVAIDYDLSFYLDISNLDCFDNIISNYFYLGEDSYMFNLNNVMNFYDYSLKYLNYIVMIESDEFICAIYRDTIFEYSLHKNKHKKRYYIVVKSIDKSPFIMLK